MRIQILGSAAAERFPGLWCECEHCRKARRNGGKDIRRATAYWLDGDTLIDFGPDIHWQVTDFNIDLCAIRRVIFTHSHSDHLSPIEFLWRKNGGFSRVTHTVDLFGPASAFAAILKHAAEHASFLSLEDDLNLRPHPLSHGQEVQDGDLSILPLDADHAPGKQPFIYLLSRGGRSVLIGNDSGWFLPRTWDALSGRSIDLAILDCTYGILNPDHRHGHMGAGAVVETANRLREMGCLKPGSRCVANHFSHNGGGGQREFEAFFTPHGIETGYDGLTIEV